MAANVLRICHFPSKCLSRSLLAPPACDSAHSAKHHKTGCQLTAGRRACCYDPDNCHDDRPQCIGAGALVHSATSRKAPTPIRTDRCPLYPRPPSPALSPAHTPMSIRTVPRGTEILEKHSHPVGLLLTPKHGERSLPGNRAGSKLQAAG